MKTLFVLLWLLAIFDIRKSEETPKINTDRQKNLQIVRIKVHGDRHYMQAQTRLYEDRKHFDIYVRLDRKLGSNYLIMNVNLRAKFVNATDFIRILDMRSMDFCSFLNEPAFRHFFMDSITFGDILECPVRVGNYSIINVNAYTVIRPEELLRGTYKFFAEIVEVTGEIPKVFAMQVTSQIT